MSDVENIDEYIEQTVENKLKDLLATLPEKVPEGFNNKPIYQYTMNEIYKNTLQTCIDILNDLTEYYHNKDSIAEKSYSQILFDIFLKDNRKIYVGIVLIFLSFIIYFIDGASI